MKKRGYQIVTALLVTTLALPAVSKVTLDDVYAADAPKRARDLANNAAYMARHSSPLVPKKSSTTDGLSAPMTVGTSGVAAHDGFLNVRGRRHLTIHVNGVQMCDSQIWANKNDLTSCSSPIAKGATWSISDYFGGAVTHITYLK